MIILILCTPCSKLVPMGAKISKTAYLDTSRPISYFMTVLWQYYTLPKRQG